MNLRRSLLALPLATAALSLMPSLVHAQAAYPSQPIKMIVNVPPGGAVDQIARVIGQSLNEAFGQPVIVENRTGAGGMVGGEQVARATPDGYTLLVTAGSMVVIGPHIYSKMSFDVDKDLVPIAGPARASLFLVAKPSLPVQDIQSFMAYLKANPGKLSYGSAGNGTSPHLAGEMFKAEAGVFAVHVPYRGAAPAMQDLLAGQIDYFFDSGTGLEQVKSGKLRLLAVANPTRSSLFPGTPTLQEAGLKGFDAGTTYGFYAPAGTPPEIVARLNAEINRSLEKKAVRERIQALGAEPTVTTPAQFAKIMKDDSRRFGAIAKARNIRPD
jgi:tripartite-type tricarboxylate transporter receptor subunit TctC